MTDDDARGFSGLAADQDRVDEPEDADEVMFTGVQEFVERYLAPVYRRQTGGQYAWCPQWWRHEEAKARLAALWYAYEHLMTEGATEPADWWIHYADPIMDRLLSRDAGPFVLCKTVHHDLAPLNCDPPPDGIFDDPAYRITPPAKNADPTPSAAP